MTITPIPPYVPAYAPIPQVQPFTYRDGVTYWEKLNGIVKYMNRVIIPYVNEHIAEFGDEFATEINALIDSVNAAIAANQTEVDSKIADMEAQFQITVDQILNSSVEVQDPVVAGIFGNAASASRVVTDGLYPAKTATETAISNLTTEVDNVQTDIGNLDSAKADKTALNTQTARIDQNVTDISNRVVKDSQVFSVLDYGVVADGVTDCSPGMVACMNAAAAVGGTVLMPPGQYARLSTMRIPAGIKISGYGAVLHRVAGMTGGTVFQNWAGGDTTTPGYEGRSNITIEGLTIDAHGDTLTTFPANIMTFCHCSNITIRDVKFRNTSGFHALEFNSVNNFVVDGCVFEGYAAAGQTLKGAIQLDCAVSPDGGASDGTMTKNGKVVNCTFRESDTMGAHDCGVESHSVNTSGGSYFNITVANNSFNGHKTYAIRPYAWRDSVVNANVINLGDNGQGVRCEGAIDVEISNNLIKHTPQNNTGIVIGVLAGYSPRGISVVGNKIYNPNQGVYVGALSAVHIANNYVYRSSSDGIRLDSAGETLVVGNYIDGPAYPSGGASGVKLSGTANGCSVTGNRVRPHGAGTEAAYAVSVDAGQANAWVFGNDFLSMPAATQGVVNTTSNRI